MVFEEVNKEEEEKDHDYRDNDGFDL